MDDLLLEECLRSEFNSVDEVITGLVRLEQILYARKDRRAVFASAYLTMTREIARSVGAHEYHDPVWVGRYAIAFANLYRTAFLAFVRGDKDRVPKPWRTSFESSLAGSNLLLQDLLLGVNAHINNDLAVALNTVSIDPNRDERKEDHFAVNEAIHNTTDAVQDAMGWLYAPVFRPLDRLLGRFDEEAANFSIGKARLSAWFSAVALASQTGPAERAEAIRAIEDGANVVARLILLPNRGGVLLTLRRWFERVAFSWQPLSPGF